MPQLTTTYPPRHSDSCPATPISPTHLTSLTQPATLLSLIAPLQCPICHRLFSEPVTLPCGRSLCRACLPKETARVNISYPGTEERAAGYRCPLTGCGMEHAVNDCSQDFIVGRIVEGIAGVVAGAEIVESEDDGWSVVGSDEASTVSGRPMAVVEPRPDDNRPTTTLQITPPADSTNTDTFTFTIRGTPLQALFLYAKAHALPPKSTLKTITYPTPSPNTSTDNSLLQSALDTIRPEADCQICYAIFLDPITTPCGHTFCTVCLHRVLSHTPHCPLCRRQLSPSSRGPSNATLDVILDTFWEQSVTNRRAAALAEGWTETEGEAVPIFPCTLAFPGFPLHLHIFEPRYRLMVRRCMEGNRLFGMVLPRRMPGDTTTGGSGYDEFAQIGTLVYIEKVEYLPDGRSMIETTGVARFKICSYQWKDGIIMAKVERVADISIAEEEELEAQELQQAAESAIENEYLRAIAVEQDDVYSHRVRQHTTHSRSRGSIDSTDTVYPPTSPSHMGVFPTFGEDPNTLVGTTHVASPTARAPVNVPGLPSPRSSPEPYEDISDPFSDMPVRIGRALPPALPPAPRTLPTNADGVGVAKDFNAMATKELLEFIRTAAFKAGQMVQGSYPERVDLFVWWFAVVMPMGMEERYGLLGEKSIRGRLKICCRWVVHEETSKGMRGNCAVM